MEDQITHLTEDMSSIIGRRSKDQGSKKHMDHQDLKKGSHGSVAMSNEEHIIRGVLEMEVERSLEEEIKDGICHLALRLHRLYQHQKGRTQKSEAFTELNISIKMDGGSKIEINESKKANKNSHRIHNLQSDYGQTRMSPSVKQFDWVKTLRSSSISSSYISSNKKAVIARQASLPANSNKIGSVANGDYVQRSKGTPASAHGRRKGK